MRRQPSGMYQWVDAKLNILRSLQLLSVIKNGWKTSSSGSGELPRATTIVYRFANYLTKNKLNPCIVVSTRLVRNGTVGLLT